MFNIAIDGVAGCGKSSLAEQLSKELNLKKFNTGMVYRAITCEYLSRFCGLPDDKKIIDLLKTLVVEVKFINERQIVLVNGKNYFSILRDEIVSNMTPFVSGFDILREKVREIQRDFARNNDCIMEGRDIGRVVLKNAQVKLFLTASDEVRAKRRYEQMKGMPSCPSFEEILQDIKKRDEEDKNRECGAMIPADDARSVDNSHETLPQTVIHCIVLIRKCKKCEHF